MSKSFWAVIVVVIIVFFGIFALTGKKSTGSNSSNSTPTNHIEGLGQDKVSLVEYGDYQCPYCGEYYPIVAQVEQEFNTQITFQFRNFPLTSLHPNAFAGARAAEAASLQGKFWQMHDLLYQQNEAYYQGGEPANSWIGATNPIPYFNADAKQLGLNLTKFESDFASNQVDDSITADMAAGNKLNIQGTPTFFLDGTQLNVGESVSEFTSLIKAAIAKKTTAAASSSTTTSTSAASGTTEQSKK
jgi:protein-disulfide isomerase